MQALKHELLPPSLHYESPNPNIDFDNSPFFVNTALTPWKRGTGSRGARGSELPGDKRDERARGAGRSAGTEREQ